MSSANYQPDHIRESIVTDPSEIGSYLLDLMNTAELVSGPAGEGPYSHFKEPLSEKIVGQDGAIESLINALNREEFRDTAKPISTFMFLGPTGVGKSQTAKEVARMLHGGSNKGFLSINCTQFKSYGDLGVLQGAPPGYKGYEQESLLKEEVINQPRSVLLFDEVEKADPALHDFLMQVMDEGEITIFNSGKKISFRDSIIILTSNAGSSEITDAMNKKSVGFSSSDSAPTKIPAESKMTEIAFGALEKAFKPEFLGRIENKVLFMHLTDEQHALALNNYIKDMVSRDGYVKRGIFLEVSPELTEYVVETCVRRQVGGFREVKASFIKSVELALQNRVLSGRIPNNSVVYAEPASAKTKESDPDAVAEFRFRRIAA